MPHIHDKIDFCSEVFIVFNNKVLLRKHDKLRKWLSVGGHIRLDEDPNEAAIREVKEEVGLEIELYNEEDISFLNRDNWRSLINPQYLNIHNITDNHEHIAFMYFAKSKTDKLILSEEEITEECKWFSKEELESNNDLGEDVKYYALKALEKLMSNDN